MSSIRSNMQRVTETMIEGYNTYSIESIIGNRAPNCALHLIPKSMNIPVESNEGYKQHMLDIWPVITDWKFIADNFVYDVEARRVAFHTTSEAKSPVGPYNNEYSWTLQFDLTGEKILEVWEFVDSAYTTDFRAKLRAWRVSQEGEGESAL